MKLVRHFRSLLACRRLHAVLCFVAALSLQSPVVAAAAIASGACCAGDHCPIAAHHHAAAKTEEMPMDCDHGMDHGANKIRSCSMSCCNTTEQSAIHSNFFLVSPVVQLVLLNSPCETISAFAGCKVAAFSSPPSPPPKPFAGLA